VRRVEQVRRAEARLRDAAGLPEVLDACFDAFELIRLIARECDNHVPTLFAAFMMTADAAVDGREAVTVAPSLPLSRGGHGQGGMPVADVGIGEITDALSALGTLLHDRLAGVPAQATTPADRAACSEAAEAAERIRHLMARDDHDGYVR